MGLIRDGLPAYTYIYNSATGNAYIDQHLKRMRKAALTPYQRKRKSVEKPKDDARKGKGKSLKKTSPAEQPLSDEYVAQCKSKVGHSLIEIYVRKHKYFYFLSRLLGFKIAVFFWKTNRRLWSIWMRRTSTGNTKLQISYSLQLQLLPNSRDF